MTILILLEISVRDFLFGENGLGFLPEVALRSVLMYAILFVALKITGKRGIKQLSVFELMIILGLGSAAGDPMLYKEVGILPVILVFVIIILLYRLTTFAVSLSPRIEEMLEGKPVYVIEDGMFCIDEINKRHLGEDEFLAELRREKITQLGQVKIAILETDGELSVFYSDDEDVKFGLPILPKELKRKLTIINKPGHYSCKFCGYTVNLETTGANNCVRCEKNEWVKASSEKRIT